MLILFFAVEAVIAAKAQDSRLDTWGNWGAIGGFSIAALLLVSGVFFWARRKIQWRKPIKASYCIPKNSYRATKFEGAPDEEQYPHRLTVGLGTYCLIHRASTQRPNLAVQGVQLEFHGEPDDVRPLNRGITSPILVNRFQSELGEQVFEDWWGMVRSFKEITRFPKHFTGDNDHWFIGHLIQTTAPWRGRVELIIRWRNERGPEASSVRIPFDFEVVGDPKQDEILFLKREGAGLGSLAV